MSSNFTQAQREFLNNVKQTIALVDRELQRIREQRIAMCMSSFELDWQLLCIGPVQSINGANKLGSMINAHTDFQAALREINGAHAQTLVTSSNNNSGADLLPKAGGDAASLRSETNTPARSSGSGRYGDSPAAASPVVSPGAN
jgi:hypothetical protein